MWAPLYPYGTIVCVVVLLQICHGTFPGVTPVCTPLLNVSGDIVFQTVDRVFQPFQRQGVGVKNSGPLF